MGWGPVDNPQYLIVVVIEKGGYGASAAAPVARDGFQYLVTNPVAPVKLSPPATGSGPPSSTTSTSTPAGGPGGSSTTTTTSPGG